MMPKANAWADQTHPESLDDEGQSGGHGMINRSGPAYLPKRPSEAVSTTLVVEPASRLSPWGVMARSSAPSHPSVSPTLPGGSRL